jgi:hypothetical protein
MTMLTRLFLAAIVVAAFSNSELLAQRGGRGKGGNQNSQANQPKRGQQGRGQAGRGQGQAGRGQGQGGQGQQGQGGQNGQRGGGGKGQGSGGALATNERSELIMMREEEKLARDVYSAMQKKWGATIFANIARAESQHMQVIGGLLSKYQIPDPIVNNNPGTFSNPKFQTLYQQLVNTGSASLIDAMKVGLKIEEMDIADLRKAIQSTDNNDLKRVYQHLEQGSQNHLRAFSMQLKKLGGTYTATSLNQNDFDSIANSRTGPSGNQGRGGSRGQGNNQGNKAGKGPGNQNNAGRGNGQGNSGRGNGGRGNGKGRGN